MHWMLMPLRRYADFSGRSRRKEYWMYTLMYVLVTVVLYAITFSGLPWTEIMAAEQGQPISGEEVEPGPLFFAGFVLILLWFIGTLVPNIAVTVRRFHDQDKSGWFYLLYLIPYIGFIVIIVFMCLEGTRGPNRFGDDPKDVNTATVFE